MNLIGTLITGRLLGIMLALWVASLGALWLYMAGSQSSAIEAAAAVAKAKAEEACSDDKAVEAEAAGQALLQAVRGALKARAEAQAELDAARDAEQAALRKEVDAARARANQLSNALRRHIDANPLPAACRLDAERVRLFNAARRGGADPRAAADRSGLPGLSGRDLPGAPAAGAGAGWHGEPRWAAVPGGAGWGSATGVLGGTDGVPGLRAPRRLGWRDPLIPEAP